MRFRILGGALALSPLAAALAAASVSAQPLPEADDFLALAALSYRASRSYAVVHQMRAESPEQVHCLDAIAYQEGSGSQGRAAPPSHPCEAGSRPGFPPRDFFMPANQWRSLPRFLFGLTSGVRVTEVAPRVVAGLEGRCFSVTDEPLRGTLCVDPGSSVILLLDMASGDRRVTMTATRVSATAMPDPAPRGDVPELLALIRTGHESAYTVDFELEAGGQHTLARSGNREHLTSQGYVIGRGPREGRRVQIRDGRADHLCEDAPGLPAGCTESPSIRIFPLALPLLPGLERQLLGDPEPEAREVEGRTVAGREARCFQVESYAPDDLFGTWSRVVRERSTVCLDRELGALLLRESDPAGPDDLVARRLVPGADPDLFVPPFGPVR